MNADHYGLGHANALTQPPETRAKDRMNADHYKRAALLEKGPNLYFALL
jgi:hypothetical protein